MKKAIVLFTTMAVAISGFSKGTEIKIIVKELANSPMILANYYGDKQYVKDTIPFDAQGIAVIKADTQIPPGIYLAVFPKLGNKYFEFVLNEPKFTLTTDTADLSGHLRVTGSPENTLFYDDMVFLNDQRKKSEAFNAAFRSAANDSAKNEIRAKLKKVDDEVRKKRDEIITKYPTFFYAKLLKSMKEVDVPEPPRDLVGRLIDSAWSWRFYKNHYWDNFDLRDDRLLRTPIFHNKLSNWYTRTIIQVPDSIIADGDVLLKKMDPKTDLFKYTLVYMLNEMAKSKIMGFDAVYVHLVKEYYSKGYATWVDSTQLYKINERGRILEPLLLGKKARNITLADTTLKTFHSVYDLKNRFVVICFWDPDCSHCKKEVPKLAESYHKMKSEGIDIEVFAPSIMSIEEMSKWTQFIRDNKMDWINVGDPYHQNNFRFEWDIQSTPQIYILDKDRKIIAKRIGAEQVEDFIRHEINPSYRPKNPPIINDNNPEELH
ncbi:MAG: redoxin domain-containing protein [Chitinophagales bacterium]